MTGIAAANLIFDGLVVYAGKYSDAASTLSDLRYFIGKDTLFDYGELLDMCIEDGVFDKMSGNEAAQWVINDIAQKRRGCLAFADEQDTNGYPKIAENLRFSEKVYAHFASAISDRIDSGFFN